MKQLVPTADSRTWFGAGCAILAIALYLGGVGQARAADYSFAGPAGASATEFPKPDRLVADIVAPLWRSEKERDGFDEPGQLVRLLGIKPGMTVADIGAGSGYLTVRFSPVVGPKGRIFAQDIEPSYLNDLGKRVKSLNLKNVTVSLGEAHDPRLPRRRSMWRSSSICIMRSPTPTPCSTTSLRRSNAAVKWASSTRARQPPGTAPLRRCSPVSSPLSATARPPFIRWPKAIRISPFSAPPRPMRASGRRISRRARRNRENAAHGLAIRESCISPSQSHRSKRKRASERGVKIPAPWRRESRCRGPDSKRERKGVWRSGDRPADW